MSDNDQDTSTTGAGAQQPATPPTARDYRGGAVREVFGAVTLGGTRYVAFGPVATLREVLGLRVEYEKAE